MLAVAASGVILVGCAHGAADPASQPGSARMQGSRATPCMGRGELFFWGEITDQSPLPPGATGIRRVRARGWTGYCYTTPESIAQVEAP